MHRGVNLIAGLFEWRAKINDAQTILDFCWPNRGETIGLAGPVGMAQCRLIDNLLDLPLSLKKLPVGNGFAIAQWLLLQTRATTKKWQYVPTLLQEFQI